MTQYGKTVLLPVYIRLHNRKIIFYFLNQNICCRYSKEPSQRVLKLMVKQIFKIFGSNVLFISMYELIRNKNIR